MSQRDPRPGASAVGQPSLTKRQLLGRRIELAAGIAAAVLALVALALVLFAPLLAVGGCGGAAGSTSSCAHPTTIYDSAVHAHLDGGAWLLILTPAALALIGAAGAVADARYGARVGLFALGLAAGMAALLCLIASAGVVGALYFPATLAVALATYGAFLARSPARTAVVDAAAPPEPPARAEPQG